MGLLRYMVIGLYVGFATVGVFIYWYVFDQNATDGHPLVSLSQLMNHGKCHSWTDFQVSVKNGFDVQLDGYGHHDDPCDYFEKGKIVASTLSLTVLVTIEMMNSLNALSEDCSLLIVPPHRNLYLVGAIALSFIAHFAILYIPPLATVFTVYPLGWREWKLVLYFSLPVILLDEVMKFTGKYVLGRKRKHEGEVETVPLLSIQ